MLSFSATETAEALDTGAPGDWRMTPTESNAPPAVLAWCRGELFGLAVLTVTEAGITGITLFGDPTVADRFS